MKGGVGVGGRRLEESAQRNGGIWKAYLYRCIGCISNKVQRDGVKRWRVSC